MEIRLCGVIRWPFFWISLHFVLMSFGYGNVGATQNKETSVRRVKRLSTIQTEVLYHEFTGQCEDYHADRGERLLLIQKPSRLGGDGYDIINTTPPPGLILKHVQWKSRERRSSVRHDLTSQDFTSFRLISRMSTLGQKQKSMSNSLCLEQCTFSERPRRVSKTLPTILTSVGEASEHKMQCGVAFVPFRTADDIWTAIQKWREKRIKRPNRPNNEKTNISPLYDNDVDVLNLASARRYLDFTVESVKLLCCKTRRHVFRPVTTSSLNYFSLGEENSILWASDRDENVFKSYGPSRKMTSAKFPYLNCHRCTNTSDAVRSKVNSPRGETHDKKVYTGASYLNFTTILSLMLLLLLLSVLTRAFDVYSKLNLVSKYLKGFQCVGSSTLVIPALFKLFPTRGPPRVLIHVGLLTVLLCGVSCQRKERLEPNSNLPAIDPRTTVVLQEGATRQPVIFRNDTEAEPVKDGGQSRNNRTRGGAARGRNERSTVQPPGREVNTRGSGNRDKHSVRNVTKPQYDNEFSTRDYSSVTSIEINDKPSLAPTETSESPIVTDYPSGPTIDNDISDRENASDSDRSLPSTTIPFTQDDSEFVLASTQDSTADEGQIKVTEAVTHRPELKTDEIETISRDAVEPTVTESFTLQEISKNSITEGESMVTTEFVTGNDARTTDTEEFPSASSSTDAFGYATMFEQSSTEGMPDIDLRTDLSSRKEDAEINVYTDDPLANTPNGFLSASTDALHYVTTFEPSSTVEITEGYLTTDSSSIKEEQDTESNPSTDNPLTNTPSLNNDATDWNQFQLTTSEGYRSKTSEFTASTPEFNDDLTTRTGFDPGKTDSTATDIIKITTEATITSKADRKGVSVTSSLPLDKTSLGKHSQDLNQTTPFVEDISQVTESYLTTVSAPQQDSGDSIGTNNVTVNENEVTTDVTTDFRTARIPHDLIESTAVTDSHPFTNKKSTAVTSEVQEITSMAGESEPTTETIPEFTTLVNEPSDDNDAHKTVETMGKTTPTTMIPLYDQSTENSINVRGNQSVTEAGEGSDSGFEAQDTTAVFSTSHGSDGSVPSPRSIVDEEDVQNKTGGTGFPILANTIEALTQNDSVAEESHTQKQIFNFTMPDQRPLNSTEPYDYSQAVPTDGTRASESPAPVVNLTSGDSDGSIFNSMTTTGDAALDKTTNLALESNATENNFNDATVSTKSQQQDLNEPTVGKPSDALNVDETQNSTVPTFSVTSLSNEPTENITNAPSAFTGGSVPISPVNETGPNLPTTYMTSDSTANYSDSQQTTRATELNYTKDNFENEEVTKTTQMNSTNGEPEAYDILNTTTKSEVKDMSTYSSFTTIETEILGTTDTMLEPVTDHSRNDSTTVNPILATSNRENLDASSEKVTTTNTTLQNNSHVDMPTTEYPLNNETLPLTEPTTSNISTFGSTTTWTKIIPMNTSTNAPRNETQDSNIWLTTVSLQNDTKIGILNETVTYEPSIQVSTDTEVVTNTVLPDTNMTGLTPTAYPGNETENDAQKVTESSGNITDVGNENVTDSDDIVTMTYVIETDPPDLDKVTVTPTMMNTTETRGNETTTVPDILVTQILDLNVTNVRQTRDTSNSDSYIPITTEMSPDTNRTTPEILFDTRTEPNWNDTWSATTEMLANETSMPSLETGEGPLYDDTKNVTFPFLTTESATELYDNITIIPQNISTSTPSNITHIPEEITNIGSGNVTILEMTTSVPINEEITPEASNKTIPMNKTIKPGDHTPTAGLNDTLYLEMTNLTTTVPINETSNESNDTNTASNAITTAPGTFSTLTSNETLAFGADNETTVQFISGSTTATSEEILNNTETTDAMIKMTEMPSNDTEQTRNFSLFGEGTTSVPGKNTTMETLLSTTNQTESFNKTNDTQQGNMTTPIPVTDYFGERNDTMSMPYTFDLGNFTTPGSMNETKSNSITIIPTDIPLAVVNQTEAPNETMKMQPRNTSVMNFDESVTSGPDNITTPMTLSFEVGNQTTSMPYASDAGNFTTSRSTNDTTFTEILNVTTIIPTDLPSEGINRTETSNETMTIEPQNATSVVNSSVSVTSEPGNMTTPMAYNGTLSSEKGNETTGMPYTSDPGYFTTAGSMNDTSSTEMLNGTTIIPTDLPIEGINQTVASNETMTMKPQNATSLINSSVSVISEHGNMTTPMALNGTLSFEEDDETTGMPYTSDPGNFTTAGSMSDTTFTEMLNVTTIIPTDLPIEGINQTDASNETMTMKPQNATSVINVNEPVTSEPGNITSPMALNWTLTFEEGNETISMPYTSDPGNFTTAGGMNDTTFNEMFNSTTIFPTDFPSELMNQTETASNETMTTEPRNTTSVINVNETVPSEPGNITTPMALNGTLSFEEGNETTGMSYTSDPGNFTTAGSMNDTTFNEMFNSTTIFPTDFPSELMNQTEASNETMTTEPRNTTSVININETVTSEPGNITTPMALNGTLSFEEDDETTSMPYTSDPGNFTTAGGMNDTTFNEMFNSTTIFPTDFPSELMNQTEASNETMTTEPRNTTSVININETVTSEPGNITTPMALNGTLSFEEDDETTSMPYTSDPGNFTTAGGMNDTTFNEMFNSTTIFPTDFPSELMNQTEASNETMTTEPRNTTAVININETVTSEPGNITTPMALNGTLSFEEGNETTGMPYTSDPGNFTTAGSINDTTFNEMFNSTTIFPTDFPSELMNQTEASNETMTTEPRNTTSVININETVTSEPGNITTPMALNGTLSFEEGNETTGMSYTSDPGNFTTAGSMNDTAFNEMFNSTTIVPTDFPSELMNQTEASNETMTTELRNTTSVINVNETVTSEPGKITTPMALNGTLSFEEDDETTGMPYTSDPGNFTTAGGMNDTTFNEMFNSTTIFPTDFPSELMNQTEASNETMTIAPGIATSITNLNESVTSKPGNMTTPISFDESVNNETIHFTTDSPVNETSGETSTITPRNGSLSLPAENFTTSTNLNFTTTIGPLNMTQTVQSETLDMSNYTTSELVTSDPGNITTTVIFNGTINSENYTTIVPIIETTGQSNYTSSLGETITSEPGNMTTLSINNPTSESVNLTTELASNSNVSFESGDNTARETFTPEPGNFTTTQSLFNESTSYPFDTTNTTTNNETVTMEPSSYTTENPIPLMSTTMVLNNETTEPSNVTTLPDERVTVDSYNATTLMTKNETSASELLNITTIMAKTDTVTLEPSNSTTDTPFTADPSNFTSKFISNETETSDSVNYTTVFPMNETETSFPINYTDSSDSFTTTEPWNETLNTDASNFTTILPINESITTENLNVSGTIVINNTYTTDPGNFTAMFENMTTAAVITEELYLNGTTIQPEVNATNDPSTDNETLSWIQITSDGNATFIKNETTTAPMVTVAETFNMSTTNADALTNDYSTTAGSMMNETTPVPLSPTWSSIDKENITSVINETTTSSLIVVSGEAVTNKAAPVTTTVATSDSITSFTSDTTTESTIPISDAATNRVTNEKATTDMNIITDFESSTMVSPTEEFTKDITNVMDTTPDRAITSYQETTITMEAITNTTASMEDLKTDVPYVTSKMHSVSEASLTLEQTAATTEGTTLPSTTDEGRGLSGITTSTPSTDKTSKQPIADTTLAPGETTANQIGDVTTGLPKEIKENLLTMKIKPLFAQDINDVNTVEVIRRGLLTAYLVAWSPRFVRHRVRRQAIDNMDRMPDNPDGVETTITSIPANDDGTADVNFYMSDRNASALPAGEVAQVFDKMDKSTLAAYVRTQNFKKMALLVNVLNSVTENLSNLTTEIIETTTEGGEGGAGGGGSDQGNINQVVTTPQPTQPPVIIQPRDETDWLMILTAVLIVVFLLLVIMLVIYWRNCYHKQAVNVTEEVEIDIYKKKEPVGLRDHHLAVNVEKGRIEKASYSGSAPRRVPYYQTPRSAKDDVKGKRSRDYVAGSDESEPRIVGYRNRAYSEDDSLGTVSLPSSLCCSDESPRPVSHDNVRHFRFSFFGDADSFHRMSLYDIPSCDESASSVFYREGEEPYNWSPLSAHVMRQPVYGRNKSTPGAISTDTSYSYHMDPKTSTDMDHATLGSRHSPAGSMTGRHWASQGWNRTTGNQFTNPIYHTNQAPSISDRSRGNSYRKQSNSGLDGAYSFENDTYKTEGRHDKRDYFFDELNEVEVDVEDFHKRDRYNPSHGDHHDVTHSVTQATVHHPEFVDESHQERDERTIKEEENTGRRYIQPEHSLNKSIHPENVDRNGYNQEEVQGIHTQPVDGTRKQTTNVTKKNVKRDDISGIPVNSDRYQAEIIEPSENITLGKVPERVALESQKVTRTEEAVIRSNSRSEIKAMAIPNQTIPSNEDSYSSYHRTPQSREGEDATRWRDHYNEPTHDGFLSLIDMGPKKVHLLPAADFNGDSQGPHFKPLNFEYSVFSASCSPTVSRFSSPLTLYSEPQVSLDSEFAIDLYETTDSKPRIKTKKNGNIDWNIEPVHAVARDSEVSPSNGYNQYNSQDASPVSKSLGQTSYLGPSDIKSFQEEPEGQKQNKEPEIRIYEHIEDHELELHNEHKFQTPSLHSNEKDSEANKLKLDHIHVDVEVQDNTLSGLSSLSESPVHISHQGMQTEGFHWGKDKKASMMDAYLQTECEMSTQTETEATTQTEPQHQNYHPFVDPVMFQHPRMSPTYSNPLFDDPNSTRSASYLSPNAYYRDYPGSPQNSQYHVMPVGHRIHPDVRPRDHSAGHDKAVGTGSLDQSSPVSLLSIPEPKQMTSIQQQTEEATRSTMHCQTEDAIKTAVQSQTEQAAKNTAQSQTDSAHKVAAHSQTETAGKNTVQSQTSVAKVLTSDKGCQSMSNGKETGESPRKGKEPRKKERSDSKRVFPDYNSVRSYSTSGSESSRCLPPKPRYPDEFARRPGHRKSRNQKDSSNHHRETSSQPLIGSMYDPWGRPYMVTSLNKMGPYQSPFPKYSDEEKYFSSGSSNSSTSSGKRLLPPRPAYSSMFAPSHRKSSSKRSHKYRNVDGSQYGPPKLPQFKSTNIDHDSGKAEERFDGPEYSNPQKTAKWQYVKLNEQSDPSSPETVEEEPVKPVKVEKDSLHQDKTPLITNEPVTDHQQISTPTNVFHHYSIGYPVHSNPNLGLHNPFYTPQHNTSPNQQTSDLGLPEGIFMPKTMFLPTERSAIVNPPILPSPGPVSHSSNSVGLINAPINHAVHDDTTRALMSQTQDQSTRLAEGKVNGDELTKEIRGSGVPTSSDLSVPPVRNLTPKTIKQHRRMPNIPKETETMKFQTRKVNDSRMLQGQTKNNAPLINYEINRRPQKMERLCVNPVVESSAFPSKSQPFRNRPRHSEDAFPLSRLHKTTFIRPKIPSTKGASGRQKDLASQPSNSRPSSKHVSEGYKGKSSILQMRKVLPPTPLHPTAFAATSQSRQPSKSMIKESQPMSSITNRSGGKTHVASSRKSMFEAELKPSDLTRASSRNILCLEKDVGKTRSGGEKIYGRSPISPINSFPSSEKSKSKTSEISSSTKPDRSDVLPKYSYSGISSLQKSPVAPTRSAPKIISSPKDYVVSSQIRPGNVAQKPSTHRAANAKPRPLKITPLPSKVTPAKTVKKQTEILVPGKRVVSSYLNDDGKKVVILAPGIGANAPLGVSPKHKHDPSATKKLGIKVQYSDRGSTVSPMTASGKIIKKDCVPIGVRKSHQLNQGTSKINDFEGGFDVRIPSTSFRTGARPGAGSESNDPLRVEPRPVHVQPPDRVPRSKRPINKPTSTEEDDSQSDMDSSSSASAGMFEHLAKMSRIPDKRHPTSLPPLKFRSSVVPLEEDERSVTSEPESEGYQEVVLQKGLPPIKLRPNVLTPDLRKAQQEQGSREHLLDNSDVDEKHRKHGSIKDRSRPRTAKRPQRKSSLETERNEQEKSRTDSQIKDKHDRDNSRSSSVTRGERSRSRHGERDSSSDKRRDSLTEQRKKDDHESGDRNESRRRITKHSGSRAYSPVDSDNEQKRSRSQSRSNSRMSDDRSVSKHDSDTKRKQRHGPESESVLRSKDRSKSRNENDDRQTPSKSQKKSSQRSKSRHKRNSVGDSSQYGEGRDAESQTDPHKYSPEHFGRSNRVSPEENPSADVDQSISIERQQSKGQSDPEQDKTQYERKNRSPKRKWLDEGQILRHIDSVIEPEPTPEPSPAARRLADLRTQRWKKTTEITADHYEERKRGRNMRAAPRHLHASDDMREVVTKEQSVGIQKSPRGSQSPPPGGYHNKHRNREEKHPKILLHQLLRDSSDRTRNSEAEVAAKQLINSQYLRQEEKTHGLEEDNLKHHVLRHLENTQSTSRDRKFGEQTHIECHLQTSLGAEKVRDLLTEAFPLANVKHGKILPNAGPMSPKSPKSCGYTSDCSLATDLSQARSAYEMIVMEGSATGLRNYSGDITKLRRPKMGHSLPGSRGESVPSVSPRGTTRGAWHMDTEEDRVALDNRKRTHRSSSPKRNQPERASSTNDLRASSISHQNQDKEELLKALQEQIKATSSPRKQRPTSAKR